MKTTRLYTYSGVGYGDLLFFKKIYRKQKQTIKHTIKVIKNKYEKNE